MRKDVLHWLPVALGIALLLMLAYVQRGRVINGQNDFVQLYTAAKLAGTPDLYSRPANLAVVKATLGFTMEGVVYTRPPFYAVLLKPLALMPYRAAYGVFSLASLAGIVWFVARFAKECPALPFFAATSIPVLTSLCGGQDTLFLLPILGGSILLARRQKDFPAGLLLSLCAIKFHLFLLAPVLLVAKKRWGILGGGACGTLILMALGWAAGGWDSMSGYIKLLRDPWINPSASVMPNVHGLAAASGGDSRLEILLNLSVLAVFGWLLSRSANYEFLLAACLVCGLLVSFHSSISDDIILLPAFVLILANCSSAPLRAAAGLILTPIPYLMVLAGAPYSAVLPLALLVLVGMLLLLRPATPEGLPAPAG